MSETPIEGNHIEAPKSELRGMSELAQAILKERPRFVLVADAHITSKPQDVAASLVKTLSQTHSYVHGDIGFLC
jgi:hypothetical protein